MKKQVRSLHEQLLDSETKDLDSQIKTTYSKLKDNYNNSLIGKRVFDNSPNQDVFIKSTDRVSF